MGTHKIDQGYQLTIKENIHGGFFKHDFKYNCSLSHRDFCTTFSANFVWEAKRIAKRRIGQRELTLLEIPPRVFYLNGKWKERK